MARIADTDRLRRLLNESDGGSLGRREIIETLGFSDDRYAQVADELVEAKLVERNRGRLGGLRLLLEAAAIVSPKPPRSGRLASEPTEPLERELYPSFEKHLVEAAGRNGESRSVILSTYRTKGGKWETPDLVEVRVTPFPMIGQWELRVATYELKRQNAWNVDSVLQTAAYDEFAHESWLVVPAGEGDWVDYFGKRTVDKASSFGIGLATFDPNTRAIQKHMTPLRKQPPSLSRLQEWLETTMERLGEAKMKERIAENIRWARSKADAGRD